MPNKLQMAGRQGSKRPLNVPAPTARATSIPGLLTAALLLVGCASTQSPSAREVDRNLEAVAAQQACAPGPAATEAPKPWESESRPFDADRMDLVTFRQRDRCATPDANPCVQGDVDAALNGVDASLRGPASPEPLEPRFCGLTMVMPGGPEC